MQQLPGIPALLVIVNSWRRCIVGLVVLLNERDYKSMTSVSSLISQLGWQTLSDRRRNSCLSLMYNSLHGLAGISTSPFRHSYKHTRSADGDTFCVLSSQTNPYKYSLYPRTIADWNALPASVKSRPVMSFHSFVLLYHMFQLDQLHLTTLQSRQ